MGRNFEKMRLKEVSVLLFLLSLCHGVDVSVNEGETDADIMKYYADVNVEGANHIASDDDISNDDDDTEVNDGDAETKDDEMIIRDVMDLTELRGRPKSGTFSNSWKSL